MSTYDPSKSPLGKEIINYIVKHPGSTTTNITEALEKNPNLPTGYKVSRGSTSAMISQLVRVKKVHYRISSKPKENQGKPTRKFVFSVYPGKQPHGGRGLHGPNWGSHMAKTSRVRKANQQRWAVKPKEVTAQIKKKYKAKDVGSSLVSVSTVVYIDVSKFERVGALLKMDKQQATELRDELDRVLI